MGHVKENWDKCKGEMGLARRYGTPTLLFIALPKQFVSAGPFVPKRGRILLMTFLMYVSSQNQHSIQMIAVGYQCTNLFTISKSL